MNRRQKIVVSVTGIFLVLLLLVGLTYAYFLTQITGNKNDKSISVSTANLALVYSDGNGTITAENIQPGKTLNEKTFTVKNAGNTTADYVVVIEDVKVTYATTVEDNVAGTVTTFESNDFVYTLTCTSDGEACNGVDIETTFPITNGILVGNDIEVGKTHTYSLIVTYKETGIDQSNDMNKTLEAKVNIADIKNINPYSDNTSSLAYNIINNAMLGKTGTKLLATPPSKVAEETSLSDYPQGVKKDVYVASPSEIWYYGKKEAFQNCNVLEDVACNGITEYSTCTKDVIGNYVMTNSLIISETPVLGCKNGIPIVGTSKYESVLSVTEDDLGVSYYYRGNVEDNYVNFNNMCWRIVRIEGDGAIKLVLEDQYDICSETIDTDGDGHVFEGNMKIESLSLLNIPFYSDNVFDYSLVKNSLINWYDSNISTSNKVKIKDDTTWCFGNNQTPYNIDTPYNILNTTKTELISNMTAFNYETKIRLKGLGQKADATLLCEKNNYQKENASIGLLTADEVVFAGGSAISNNISDFYLYNSYHRINDIEEVFMSVGDYNESGALPGQKVESLLALYRGMLDFYDYPIAISVYYRPSISLISGILILDGVGTQSDPYVIG